MEEIKDLLKLLNPWWEKNLISEELALPYRRWHFSKIQELAKHRQIIILSGLRRVGKTTLLYQVIQELLKKTDSRRLVYFNFDKKVEDLTVILETYGNLVDLNWKSEKIYLFLDEVTKLSEWASKIKLLYDAFPNLRFFVSSSGSFGMEEEAIKNLGGRYFMINIKPLLFTEFLELKGKGGLAKNPSLFEKELKLESENYLLRSFPEIIEWKDELLIKDYLRTTILDKIIKSDLTEKFHNVNRDLLFNLLEIFYNEPGMYVDYDGLSKKMRISKKTLIKHIFYLEFSYLVRRIRNFRISTLSSSRKLQRIYAFWWSLVYCYTNNFDRIMENVVASQIDAKYYWRDQRKEIDFIIKDKKIIPLEVKNKKDLSRSDLRTMEYFLEKYSLKVGLVIYNGKEDELQSKNWKIKLIPLWKWLLNFYV